MNTSRFEEAPPRDFLGEGREHLAELESGLLALEKDGSQAEGVLDRVCQAAHAIRMGAGFSALTNIGELAHRMENVLERMRAREIALTAERVEILRRGADRLAVLLEDPAESDTQDIAAAAAELEALCAQGQVPASLRILLVEDDFTSRLVLQRFLGRYGECHIAVNGREAVEAFSAALKRGKRYDLICMDIMMPEMDGHEAVQRVRAMEEEQGIASSGGVKIVMTTALDDIKEVSRSYMELCDGYLVKPVNLNKLRAYLRSFGLLQ